MTRKWQQDDSGVFLFEPSTVHATQAEDATSIEIRVAQMNIKSETDSVDSRADSPTTITGDETHNILTPTSSAAGSDQGWLEQLEEYLTDADSFRELDSISPNIPSSEGYASGSRNNLQDPQTPCPSRTIHTQQLSTSDVSRDSEPQNNHVVRRLDFQRSSTARQVRARSSAHNKKASALDTLRDIERGTPPHKWTDEERITLCVLYKFYDREDGNAITRAFNQLHGLDLPTRRIKAQFENHLRLYGPRAFPYYAAVFNCPLEDPDDRFLHVRLELEEAARAVGVLLKRRYTDDTTPSGRAARAKAESTRKNYKTLIRRAEADRITEAYRTTEALTRPQASSVTTAPVQIGGFAVTTTEEEERLVNIEAEEALDTAGPDTPTSSYQGANELHHLAFRVWDSDSRTIFSTERGFVSEIFSIWRGPTLPPPDPETEEGRNCQLLLSNVHLNKKGNASAYVSVATSIIQVLNYATNKLSDSLQVAVIDLNHSSLQVPHKQLRAAKALKELKSLGQAHWAKYKGVAEVMIWADIPVDTVVFHGSLSEVAAKVTGSPSGQLLLNPADWTPDQPVYNLTKKLKARNIVLDQDLARACGSFAKAIGLARAKVTLEHITEFVQCLVDGWSLQCHLMEDIHMRSSIASAFAIALNVQVLMLQEVMTAFIAGVERGLENIAYFSRRRTRAGRENMT